MSSHLEALALIKRHPGTSGATALAKLTLSLWNRCHRFSMSEILQPLDENFTRIALAMCRDYAQYGETPDLLESGRWVYDNYEGLVEISSVQHDAYCDLMRKREEEREREALKEEAEEERIRQERRARAKPLHCGYCKQDTTHTPTGHEWWRCDECGEDRL